MLRFAHSKCQGEWVELRFAAECLARQYSVSKPYGDSTPYDFIVDLRPYPVIYGATNGRLARKKACHPERGRAPARLLWRGRPESKDLGVVFNGVIPSEPSAFAETAGRSEGPAVRSFRHQSLGSLRGKRPSRSVQFVKSVVRLSRVQVKSVSTRGPDGAFHIAAMRSVASSKKPYHLGDFDFLAAYIIPLDLWYLVPIAEVAGIMMLAFAPGRPRRRLEKYRNAWHLLKGG